MAKKCPEPIVRRKHIPQRSCVVCREKKAKKALVRLVRCDSVIEVDLGGKKAGRGAFLCPWRECWEIGLKGDRLEHALHSKLSAENRQALIEYGQVFPRKSEKHD